MLGLFVEAELVILEKPTVHCRPTPFYNVHSCHVRDNVLGPRLESVSSYHYVPNIYCLVISTPFFDWYFCRNRQQDLINAMGSMYAAVLFLGVQNASAVQPVVAVERTVFYRERAAGMYSAFPYAFGQVKFEGLSYTNKNFLSNSSKRMLKLVLNFWHFRLWLSFRTCSYKPWYMAW